MPYTYTVTDKSAYLLFIVKGATRVFEDLTRYVSDLIMNARTRNMTRIMLDERDLSLAVDAHDAIQLGEHLVDMNAPSMGLRVAVICAADNCAQGRAFETALQNRSINYRAFEDVAAAEAWLVS